jgi:hypothetical protein
VSDNEEEYPRVHVNVAAEDYAYDGWLIATVEKRSGAVRVPLPPGHFVAPEVTGSKT